MPLLFCYGSNHPGQLAERLGHATTNTGAYAPGWARVFRGWSERWGGGVASLVGMKDVTTYGYVAQVTASDLETMDVYEGVATGHYDRATIDVVVGSTKKKATVYLANAREKNKPSKAYLTAIAKTIGAFWEGSDGPVKPSDITIR